MKGGETLQPNPEHPTREQIVAKLLEVSLLVPRPKDAPPEGSEIFSRQELPLWLRNAYSHTYRHDMCKVLAGYLVPKTDLEFESDVPIIKEEPRQKLIEELVKAAPIPQSRHSQISEAVRLDETTFSGPNLSRFFEAGQRIRALRRELRSLSDDELKGYINQERYRIANYLLEWHPVSLAYH